MTFEENYNAAIRKYHVTMVEATLPPAGMTGSWHHYVIGEGDSKIDGKRCGSLEMVREHAESVAESLNDRAERGGTSAYVACRK